MKREREGREAESGKGSPLTLHIFRKRITELEAQAMEAQSLRQDANAAFQAMREAGLMAGTRPVTLLNLTTKLINRAEKAEAHAAALDSINGQLQGLIRTAREQLNDLLVDEDLDDEKLRAASEELLPNIVDRFTAALAEEKEKRSE
jgi:hypothetical protein